MNNEILRLKGMLSDVKHQLEECELKAESFLIQVRETLDPYTEFENLELEKARLLLNDFQELQKKFKELLTRKNKLEKDLGL